MASPLRPPFSRSYGGILPSSLTTIHSSPQYSLPDHLSRFRVRAARTSRRGFSRQHGITLLPPYGVTIRSQTQHQSKRGGFANPSSYTLGRGQPSPRGSYPPASPLLLRLTTTGSGHTLHQPPPEGSGGFGCLASPASPWTVLRRYGNINPLSIDYACRPRLRSRLTQGG